jgi:hypothetical protein
MALTIGTSNRATGRKLKGLVRQTSCLLQVENLLMLGHCGWARPTWPW